MPPIALKMSKKWMCLNCKQYKHRLQDTSDISLKNVTVEKKYPTVADILLISIIKYITITINKCGYSGTG